MTLDPGPASGPRPHRSRARLGLALASLLLALLLAEGVVRLALQPPPYRAGMHQDPELGHRVQPFSVHTMGDERGEISFRANSLGFRGPELPPEGARTPGVRRLLFIGDSFLFARAVRDEELVSQATVRALEARGIPAEAFDLSCPDYGTAQELLLLRRYGRRAAPDQVVLLMFPGNDVANNAFELAGRTGGNDGDYYRPYLDAEGRAVRFAHPLRAFLRNRLRSFAWFENRLLVTAHARGWSWPSLWGERLQEPGSSPILRAHAPGEPYALAWERTEDLVRVFRDEVAALGAELLVLVVPQRVQVQRQPYNRESSREGTEEGADVLALDWNLPERRLHAFFAREGIDAILLLEDLRAALAADPSPLYARDFHLSGRAHLLAAERIAAWSAAPEERASLRSEPRFSAPVELLTLDRPLPLLPGTPARFTCLGHDAALGARAPAARAQGEARNNARDDVPDDAPDDAGPGGVLVLKECGGDLVLRGITRQTVPVPLDLVLAFDGRELDPPLRIEARGPFDLRLPASRMPAGRSEPREIVLDLRPPPGAASAPERPWSLLLTEIGFVCAE